MKILLALPAYNEEASLPALLESFRREMDAAGYEYGVLVVDDGSRDATPRILEEWSAKLPLQVVRHPVNLGLGETIQDALRAAARASEPEDIIVTMDADNTHSPALIRMMIPLLEQGHEVVIASRYRPGAKVVGLSPFRHLMSFGARVLFQALFPIRGVRDYTCGFRAYRAALIQKAFAAYQGNLVTEKSFACMAEILLKLTRLRPSIREVPMVLRYDQKGGASKMRVGRTVIKTLRLMLRQRF